jgi:host factor-I protein
VLLKDQVAFISAHSQGARTVEPANRRLIRPSLNEPPKGDAKGQRPPRADGPKRSSPPEQTNAENFYYLKQMQSKTRMTIVLRDGETLHGVIEWYDKDCLKVNRDGDPNLLIYKWNIKYMYKAL